MRPTTGRFTSINCPFKGCQTPSKRYHFGEMRGWGRRSSLPRPCPQHMQSFLEKGNLDQAFRNSFWRSERVAFFVGGAMSTVKRMHREIRMGVKWGQAQDSQMMRYSDTQPSMGAIIDFPCLCANGISCPATDSLLPTHDHPDTRQDLMRILTPAFTAISFGVVVQNSGNKKGPPEGSPWKTCFDYGCLRVMYRPKASMVRLTAITARSICVIFRPPCEAQHYQDSHCRSNQGCPPLFINSDPHTDARKSSIDVIFLYSL